MSCIFTRLLPRRARQSPPGGDVPHAASLVTRAFRRIDNSIIRYQTRQEDRRFQEVWPFNVDNFNPDIGEMDSDSHRDKRVKVEEPPTKPLTCCICCNEVDGTYLQPCMDCKKPYCYDCVRRQFSMALKNREQMPLKCCRKIFYHQVAQQVVSPEDLETYKQRYDESITPNPFYCPKPACSAFIPPRHLKPVRGRITCQRCRTIACIKCKEVADPLSHVCHGTSEADEIIKKLGYKRCPKCNTAAQRMYGCPHVRCTNCAAHFCWDCLRPINICNVKPCATARDEGEYSEEDEIDQLSDDEGNESIRNTQAEGGQEIPVAARAAASNVDVSQVTQPALPAPRTINSEPDLRCVADQHANQEPPLATLEGANALLQLSIPVFSNGTLDITAEAPQVDRPVTQPEAPAVSLDDPHRADVSWEADYDFGDEPTDEGWDIWGCLHRFNVLANDRIPDHWLAGLDKTKAIELECMGCFRDIKIEPPKRLSVESKGKENEAPRESSEDGITIVAVEQDNTTTKDVDTLTIKVGQKLREKVRADKKKMVYDCRECGVIYCIQCRRSALKRVEKLKAAGRNEDN